MTEQAFYLPYIGDLHVHTFEDTISVSGITLRYLFKTLPMDVMFTMCCEKQKELHTTMRNNITGKPSFIFHLYHEKDKTCIRGNEHNILQSIKGFDTTAFFIACIDVTHTE